MVTNRLYRLFYLALYYGFARHLPASNARFSFGGGKLRLFCASHLFKYCAPTANIEHGARFGDGHGIEIGYRSSIGINCHVPNNIKIGDNVMMGPECFVLQNVTHVFDDITRPMIEQGSRRIECRTEIGDDVWIGRQAIIMSGKHIGSHSIIAAGTVVCRDVDDWVIAGGNPVREIRKRK